MTDWRYVDIMGLSLEQFLGTGSAPLMVLAGLRSQPPRLPYPIDVAASERALVTVPGSSPNEGA